MSSLKLKILTPQKIVAEKEISSITAPGADGELTVLPRHISLFTLLKEGVVKIRSDAEESFFSIGGGYLETNGKEVTLLVSRAFHQDEIDEAEVHKAKEKAERLIAETSDEHERTEALHVLRRSLIDLKVLKRVPHRRKPS